MAQKYIYLKAADRTWIDFALSGHVLTLMHFHYETLRNKSLRMANGEQEIHFNLYDINWTLYNKKGIMYIYLIPLNFVDFFPACFDISDSSLVSALI